MVRIVATIKIYQDIKSLFVVSMHAVEDHNEITHHLLDCMMTHAIATKGPVPGSAAAESIKAQKASGSYNATFASPSGMLGGPKIKAELGGGGDDELHVSPFLLLALVMKVPTMQQSWPLWRCKASKISPRVP